MIHHGLQEVCKVFYFDNNDPNLLLMVSLDKIMTFDFVKEKTEDMYDFVNDLNEQPEFFTFNKEQEICIIASSEDGLMINMSEKDELDLDSVFSLSDIKIVVCDENSFYCLANKRF